MFKNFFNRMYYGKSNKKDLLKEDMSTNKFQLFFEILGVRFWDLVKLNLVVVIFALPLVLWSIWSINVFADFQEKGLSAEDLVYQVENLKMTYLLGLIPCLVILGPVLSGANYVIRKYADDNHAWLWSDLKEHSLSNIKQSILLMLIIGVSIYIFDRAVQHYNIIMQAYQFMSVLKWMLIILFGIYILSMIFAFPMLVTYKLKLKQIIKNSILLGFANLPVLLLFWVIVLLPLVLFILISLAWQYAMFIAGLYYILFGVAFSLFIFNSFTNGVFKKYMKPEEDEIEEKDHSGNETGQIEE